MCVWVRSAGWDLYVGEGLRFGVSHMHVASRKERIGLRLLIPSSGEEKEPQPTGSATARKSKITTHQPASTPHEFFSELLCILIAFVSQDSGYRIPRFPSFS